MNCKPGDLAFIVINSQGNDGRFVTVLAPYCGKSPRDPGQWWLCTCPGPLKTDARTERPGARVIIHDSALRPIRNPGELETDEALTWLPPVPLPTIDPSLLEKA